MQNYYIASTAAYQVPISSTAYKVLSYLQQCADYKTRTCFPKRKTIAAKCGISVRSVVRSINNLCAADLLKRTFQFARFAGDNAIRQKENLYAVIDEPQEALPCDYINNHGVNMVNNKSLSNGRTKPVRLYAAKTANFSTLTGNELKVYNYITLRAGKQGSCYLSKKAIATACNCSTITVYRCIKCLANQGLLCVQAQTRKEFAGNDGTACNLYTVVHYSQRFRLASIKLLFACLLNQSLCCTPISSLFVTGGHITVVTPGTPTLKNMTSNRKRTSKNKD